KSELARVVDALGIRAEVKYGARVERPESWGEKSWGENQPAHSWTVTLRNGRRRYTVDFYGGAAVGEPSAADVLACLASDATSAENARSFEEWCSDFGTDTDSRRAERTYNACVKT